MLIGLTGGMGCGKSSALQIFSELSWNTLDADAICHDFYLNRDSEIYHKVYERWGKQILSGDGSIDRRVIGKLVFSDSASLEWLNSILHPAILQRGLELYTAAGEVDTIFDVPLLYEVCWEKHFDAVVTIWTEDNLRIERLKSREMTKEDIRRKDKFQITPELKVEKADYVLINNGDMDHLRNECIRLTKKLNK